MNDATRLINLQSSMRMILTLVTFAKGDTSYEIRDRIFTEIRKLAKEALEQ